ncbi:glycosyltransferase [Aristophania vespae]|uniref:Glycosyltransferase n=1 Tax=Aristophania vespae TaxID=2697033 RepID=A0A6P1NGC5_9PROT|nr:glycosyltransferase family 2 protein [Aristophania vespae]QHI94934.1 glycosyltransferase [Aristophania vespae]QHI96283.1 glycosyltransferase [Aristophania vespae]UMM64093.1 Dodecaprenyl-phosphate galacturonate synthase [Aristophania vespae]
MKGETPTLAVIVTVLNEAENILPVCEEISVALSSLPCYEVIFVNDGSEDATLERLIEARRLFLPQLRILNHSHCLGKSASLRTAISHARAPWIATMDGDGQDDPNEIPKLYQLALKCAQNGEAPLIVGVRRKRRDRISRRFATRFANGLRRRFLNDQCPDTGAPLKVFLREKFLELPQFEGLHRFLPALMGSYGVTLHCLTVTHRPRLHGTSKYTNLNRALVGIRDLLGVKWLQKRTRYSREPTEL